MTTGAPLDDGAGRAGGRHAVVVDCGTPPWRAVVVRVRDGGEPARAVRSCPHAVVERELAATATGGAVVR